jgi:hypothetical protein
MTTDGLLTQHMVARIIGAARLLKLRRCGWLVPVPGERAYRTPPIFYSERDVHSVIRRFERGERPRPDSAETARVRESEIRHGRAYVSRKNVESASDFASLDLSNL